MNNRRHLSFTIIVLSMSLCSPCGAEEIILNGKPCNTLCQVWMGVKPERQGTAVATAPLARREDHAPVVPAHPRLQALGSIAAKPPAASPSESVAPPAPATPPADEAHDAFPSAEQGAKLPALDTLVAVRGAIIVESASDLALKRKQLAILLKETTRTDIAH